jgi:hypothetical protein
MPATPAPRPAATATIIRVAPGPARKWMRMGLIVTVVCTILAIALVVIFVRSAGRSAEAWPSIVAALISLALPGWGIRGGVRTFQRGLDMRNLFVATDETGLWVSQGTGLKVVPWDSVAAAALHWSRAENPTGKDYSIELCPNVAIDPQDPVLGSFVRDDEPFRPGLPRLRYRFNGNYPYREALVEAIRQHAPHLWAGEHEREPGYLTNS